MLPEITAEKVAFAEQKNCSVGGVGSDRERAVAAATSGRDVAWGWWRGNSITGGSNCRSLCCMGPVDG